MKTLIVLLSLMTAAAPTPDAGVYMVMDFHDLMEETLWRNLPANLNVVIYERYVNPRDGHIEIQYGPAAGAVSPSTVVPAFVDGGYPPSYLVNPPTPANPWFVSPEYVDGGYPPSFVANAPTQATPWYTSPEFVDGGYPPSYLVNPPTPTSPWPVIEVVPDAGAKPVHEVGPNPSFQHCVICGAAPDGGQLTIVPGQRYVIDVVDNAGSAITWAVGQLAVDGTEPGTIANVGRYQVIPVPSQCDAGFCLAPTQITCVADNAATSAPWTRLCFAPEQVQ